MATLLTEEQIMNIVLEEQGITYSGQHEEVETADYIVGTLSTADGYEIYAIYDNKYNYVSMENGGEDAIFMYEDGQREELIEIIKNNSSIKIGFMYSGDVSMMEDLDWEDIADEIGIDLEEKEKELEEKE